MIRKKDIYTVIWWINFTIWCVYWWLCQKFNNGLHYDRTYWFFGWLRANQLNLCADEHPTFDRLARYWAWHRGGKSWVAKKVTGCWPHQLVAQHKWPHPALAK